MKITVVGGGSYSWVAGLAKGFMMNPFFGSTDTMCLMDINESALEDTFELCQLYKKKLNHGMQFTKTTDLTEALTGSSYIIVAISHGGLDAELEDHRITRKYGFYNIKGSEVGIAGCSRTWRQVPELVRIAREMEKCCPEAMMLNVTNPLTVTTRAVNKYTSIKAVGFCHGVINHLGFLFPYIGSDGWKGIEFEVGGIDHCSWLLSVKHFGKDALQIVKDKGLIEAAKDKNNELSHVDHFMGRENQRIRMLLWDIKVISNARSSARERIKATLQGEVELNMRPTDEIIDKFIAALNGGTSFTDVMNYPNIGQIPNLPLHTVVETKCLVDATGVHPVQLDGLPPILESIVRPLGIRQELYMEAAMENNRNKLRSALAMDPIVNDFLKIDDVCDEIVAFNHQFRK